MLGRDLLINCEPGNDTIAIKICRSKEWLVLLSLELEQEGKTSWDYLQIMKKSLSNVELWACLFEMLVPCCSLFLEPIVDC